MSGVFSLLQNRKVEEFFKFWNTGIAETYICSSHCKKRVLTSKGQIDPRS